MLPVNNETIATIQNIEKDKERTNEILGIKFFSVLLAKPITDKTIPTVPIIIVTKSPIRYPTYAILVGSTNTIKKQITPTSNEI